MMIRRQKKGFCGWCNKKLERCYNKEEDKWEEICIDSSCIRYGIDQSVKEEEEKEGILWII